MSVSNLPRVTPDTPATAAPQSRETIETPSVTVKRQQTETPDGPASVHVTPIDTGDDPDTMRHDLDQAHTENAELSAELDRALERLRAWETWAELNGHKGPDFEANDTPTP